jgi:hypothetical protein
MQNVKSNKRNTPQTRFKLTRAVENSLQYNDVPTGLPFVQPDQLSRQSDRTLTCYPRVRASHRVPFIYLLSLPFCDLTTKSSQRARAGLKPATDPKSDALSIAPLAQRASWGNPGCYHTLLIRWF